MMEIWGYDNANVGICGLLSVNVLRMFGVTRLARKPSSSPRTHDISFRVIPTLFATLRLPISALFRCYRLLRTERWFCWNLFKDKSFRNVPKGGADGARAPPLGGFRRPPNGIRAPVGQRPTLAKVTSEANEIHGNPNNHVRTIRVLWPAWQLGSFLLPGDGSPRPVNNL